MCCFGWQQSVQLSLVLEAGSRDALLWAMPCSTGLRVYLPELEVALICFWLCLLSDVLSFNHLPV